jgi:hypothetical protein
LIDFNNKQQIYYEFLQETLQIIQPRTKSCLTANLKSASIDFVPCEATDINQKWEFGYKNMEALNNWASYGAKFRDNPFN